MTGKRGIGIPTILLHDAEGTTVTIELKSGRKLVVNGDRKDIDLTRLLQGIPTEAI